MYTAIWLALANAVAGAPQKEGATARLRATVAATPSLPLQVTKLELDPPVELGMVSSVAADRDGRIYILQRGDAADPVIVVDASGKVLRSWGRGLYEIPHNIRIDPDGNV